MKLRVRLIALIGACVGVLGLPAQTTFTWSPTAATDLFEDAANWSGTAPTPGGALVFGPSTGTTVKLNTSIDVASLSFSSTAVGHQTYSFGSPNASVLGIGGSGIVTASTGSGYVSFAAGMGVRLTASQTWDVAAGWTLDVVSNLSGAFGLTKAGDGDLALGGTNTFSGGLTITGGAVYADANGALGTGNNVVINAMGPAGWAELSIGTTQQTIGALTFGGASGAGGAYNSIDMSTAGRLTLGGNVTVDSGSRSAESSIWGGTLVLGGSRTFNVMDSPYAWTELRIFSAIEGAGATLTKTGGGTLELSGANAYTGGTVIQGGTLQIAAAGALPAGGNITLNSTGGPATLELGGVGTHSVGSLTIGGTGASAFGSNRVTISPGTVLALGGPLTFAGTNGPIGARIEGGTIDLGATSRTFDIGNSLNADIDVTIASLITGAAGVTKTGAGTLLLTGNNTFSGGLTVGAGTLVLGTFSSATETTTTTEPVARGAGTGTLTLLSGAALAGQNVSGDEMLQVPNAVSIATDVTLGTSTERGGAMLKLTGPVTATAPSTTIHLAPESATFLTGSLGGAATGTSLTFHSLPGTAGVVVLGGTTASTISTLTADHAGIFLAHPNAAPSTLTLAAINSGYIGVVATDAGSVPSPAVVLTRIANKPGFAGTFGLDTFSDTLTPHVFTDNLDLSGFGTGFTLGSKSVAVISGAITPPAQGYTFGNGGGVLVVRSNLGDVGGSKSVSVASTSASEGGALLAVFQGNNTYTGAFSITNSGAILDSAGALPAGRGITLGANGYVGYTEAFTGVPNFAALALRISSYTATSVLGFDSHQLISSGLATPTLHSYAARFVNDTVDLTSFGPIYLGTATRAIIAGPVRAPNQGGANRALSLIGVGEGELEIRSVLGGANVTQVVVGSADSVSGHGSVMLSAQNTYSGGTTLHSGTLALGTSSRLSGTSITSGPLGTGPLTISNSGHFPMLTSASYGQTVLHNPILLGGRLQLGGFDDEGFSSMSSSAATSSFSGYFYDRLVLAGAISDLGSTQVGTLHVQGDTVLGGANTFSGGVRLQYGDLTIGHNSALGTGTLTVDPIQFDGGGGWVRLSTGDGPRTISNNVVINSPQFGYFMVGGRGSLTITGTVTLGNNPKLAPEDYPLFLNGPVTGPAALTSYGRSPVILNNSTTTPNNYAGGTVARQGSIIFGNANSLPANGLLTAGWSGYVGVAQPSLQATFLNRFNRVDTDGTIGFDSLTAGTTNTFAGPIDLGGFNSSAQIGSATRAVLSGTIVPQGMQYRFGGGGGYLEIATSLGNAGTDVRSLRVSSPEIAPLTLRLTGTNSFSGGASAQQSALIFKSGSLPAAGNLAVQPGGYIGTEDTALLPADFIGRFSLGSSGGIIGFDSFSGTPYTIADAISLARFATTTDPRLFLGSATAATFNGAITLPAAQNAYRFAGYKGGQVTVNSTLEGTRSVEIGDPYSAATHRSPADVNGALSTVTLAGANTYSAGTRLYAGALGIGSNAALGTGALTVETMYGGLSYEEKPQLFASGSARALLNSVSLQRDLEITGPNALALSGIVSGGGALFKTGAGTLTLSGANTFSGGIYVGQGNVTLASLTAAGTGMLEFGGPLSASATIAQNAVIYGIAGESGLNVINIDAGRTLTVNQQDSATYAGQFSLGTGSSLVFAGPAGSSTVLRLTGTSSYAGQTRIQNGITMVAAGSSVFGVSSVTVDGGGLALEPGVTLSNPLTVNSGILAGAGTFQPGGTLNIGSGVIVSPGGPHGPATLTFAGTSLNLLGGGTYRWQIADALLSGSWDQINVGGAVAINAGTSVFTFAILPAGPLDLLATVANFDPMVAQSWPVLTASSITVTGSLADAFYFDTGYVASLIAGGSFSFSLNSTNTALMLNFTPVPEPSTYVLLGLGAAVLLFAQRRRRR